MKYRIEHITDTIVQIRQDVITGCPTNCFVVRAKNRNYIIDTGFGSETARIIREHLDNSVPSIVINTHYHWDHMWGNGAFPEFDLVAHSNMLQKLAANWDTMLANNAMFQRGDIVKRQPSILFDSKLLFPKDNIMLFHSEGHSEDGISIFLENESILIVGDNVGDNDQEIVPYLECDSIKYDSVLDQYISLMPRLILSGHNVPVGVEFVKKIKQSLQEQ